MLGRLRTPINYFWSATPVASTLAKGWYVSFGEGDCYSGLVCAPIAGWCDCASGDVGYVRCVIGGNSTITNRYDSTSTPGVVKDNLTGLWWEKPSSGTINWNNLQSYCSGRNTGGINKWRPPTVKELSTLVDYKVPPGRLTMNIAFSGEPANWYLSSSAVSGFSGYAWFVLFSYGYVNYGDMNYTFYVRCVCSGPNCLLIPTANWKAETGVYADATNQTGRYKVENGVVTDTFTNLQWEQENSNSTMPWINATDYCADRNAGGHQGWRLPTVQELQSLVDYTINWKGVIPGINDTAFPNTPLNYFWSATPMAGGTPVESWYVSYGKDACYAGLVYSKKWGNCDNDVGYVRCVHGNVIPPITNNRYDNTSIADVVKDLLNGLMWERQASSSTMLWQNANTYCTSQNTGKFSGWRLPNVKELLTLLNYNITPGKL